MILLKLDLTTLLDRLTGRHVWKRVLTNIIWRTARYYGYVDPLSKDGLPLSTIGPVNPGRQTAVNKTALWVCRSLK